MKDKEWIEETPYYFVHKESGCVVRDYQTDDDSDGWIILDSEGMMFSCNWEDTKEKCMEQVESIFAEEGKSGFLN